MSEPTYTAYKFTLCAAGFGVCLIFLRGVVTLGNGHDYTPTLSDGDVK